MEELTLKTLLFTIVKNKALNRLSHFEIKRKVHQEIVDKYDSAVSYTHLPPGTLRLKKYMETFSKYKKRQILRDIIMLLRV